MELESRKNPLFLGKIHIYAVPKQMHCISVILILHWGPTRKKRIEKAYPKRRENEIRLRNTSPNLYEGPNMLIKYGPHSTPRQKS